MKLEPLFHKTLSNLNLGTRQPLIIQNTELAGEHNETKLVNLNIYH